MRSCHPEVNDVIWNGVPDKVYTYIIQPMGLTKTFFDKFPLCDLKGESHIFVYMDKIFSQHYFSNSPCNSLAELEDYNYPSNTLYIFIPCSSPNLSRHLPQPWTCTSQATFTNTFLASCSLAKHSFACQIYVSFNKLYYILTWTCN